MRRTVRGTILALACTAALVAVMLPLRGSLSIATTALIAVSLRLNMLISVMRRPRLRSSRPATGPSLSLYTTPKMSTSGSPAGYRKDPVFKALETPQRCGCATG